MQKSKDLLSYRLEEAGDLAPYLFHQGTNYKAYEYLGVHREGDRTLFRVWAPNAKAVFLTGSFNGWNTSSHRMNNIGYGVWELAVENARRYDEYKYYICKQNGERRGEGDGTQCPERCFV